MRNRELARQLQRLNNLFQQTDTASGSNIEFQSHWAKYLCVLSAGFIENSISEIYSDFVKRTTPEPVANYANTGLARIQNPKTSKFIETARAFKVDWANELEDFVMDNGEERKTAIDSIMSNRHRIAHGKNSGVTVIQIRQWLDRAIEVIELIENQCYR
jgi:hypothetical protein